MTTEDREVATKSLIESMKQRFPEKGFQIHSDITFSCRDDDGMGMRVITTSDIVKDEILLVIPDSSRMSVPLVTDRRSDLKFLVQKVEQRCEQQSFAESHDPREFSLALVIMYLLAQKRKKGSLSSNNNDDDDDDGRLLQTATWPSEEEMKISSIYYLDDDRNCWINSIGKNMISQTIPERQRLLRLVFQQVIYPVLGQADSIGQFCIDDSNNSEQALWETFQYAFSLVWSRAHNNPTDDSPELIPLIENFNGNSEAQFINVDIAKGKWPFLKGDKFRDDFNLPCSAIYANRDIAKGEELILSYGDLRPSEFLLKYGVIPLSIIAKSEMMENVQMWCPADLVPSDALRVRALEGCNNFPLEGFRIGNIALATLDVECLLMYRSNFQESPELASMRQFLILAQMANDSEVQLNIDTGRLRVAGNPQQIGRLLCQIIDYNLDILLGGSSKEDVERARNGQSLESSGLLLGRTCQRETLLQWRHLFCQRYGIENSCANASCRVCGRSYPKLTCTRCKWRGETTAAHYCSREHQKKDWKYHKPNCKAK